MEPHQLFVECGQVLCGSGPFWKAQFGHMLEIRTDSIDNMAKGDSRIPPGVWADISRLLNGQQAGLENARDLVRQVL